MLLGICCAVFARKGSITPIKEPSYFQARSEWILFVERVMN